MNATARPLALAPPAPSAAVRPALRAVPPPRRRPRAPRAATLALYALGMCAGFLLAAVASAPGGGGVVAGQLWLAATAALVAAPALARARAVARRARRARRV